jgi:hypothetical protein
MPGNDQQERWVIHVCTACGSLAPKGGPCLNLSLGAHDEGRGEIVPVTVAPVQATREDGAE